MRAIDLQPSASSPPDAVPPAPTPRLPRHRLALIGGVLVVALAAILTTRVVQMRKSAAGTDPPIEYAMACRVCKARFSMPASTYRTLLAARANKTFNRIPCPQCRAEDAAFRTESGMDGLGELGPEGVPIADPRNSQVPPGLKSKATPPTN